MLQNFIVVTFSRVSVGGGSAGSVLANRLTEDDATVAVLEAGRATYPLADKPSNYLDLQLSPIDWAFLTEPQENACLSLQGQVSLRLLEPQDCRTQVWQLREGNGVNRSATLFDLRKF